MEVNSTFYNTSLSEKHSLQWLHDVSGNDRFVFIVKLFRGFTHTFQATRNDVLAVHRLLDPLLQNGKLAGPLLQFPYSFTNLKARLEYVVQLKKIFQNHRLFVELRHNSWNNPETIQRLQESGLNVVNVDLPRIKQHMPLTAFASGGTAFFRLMGRNGKTWDRPWRVEEKGKYMVSDRYNYYYSQKELEELVEYIQKVRMKSDSTFAIFHTDPQAHSLVNGFQLRHIIDNSSRKVSAPRSIVTSHPQLQSICNTNQPLSTLDFSFATS
ncbi:MAG: hypothetical protein HW374_925 [Bacteroidetes bacterium]|nr:hypothetical protein [Bacteroidota bacterium]